MPEVTQLLQAIQQGQPQAADALLPLVYDELRKLAAAKMAHEKPGQTLEATALVHEAYLRLVALPPREGGAPAEPPSDCRASTPDSLLPTPSFHSRGHFFAAAAEAMRRILVESARRKQRLKHGGDLVRKELAEQAIRSPVPSEELLAVDEALEKLESMNSQAAHLVKLRYFAGFTIPQAAENMGISARKADQIWAYARAWLVVEIGEKSPSS